MQFNGTSEWETLDATHFAQGGNSLVYKATRAGDDQTYAIKYFKHSADNRALDRFRDEIDVVKALGDVPGCVKYVDHGTLADKPFYAMPYFKNGTFRDKYISDNSIPFVDKIQDFITVLLIVQEIHNRGLAIRDIKPQNILIDDDFQPVIADFGLSMWVDTPDEERKTRLSEAVGSQGYRPPEWDAKYPSPNHCPGDIWSLGRTLWAMIAGRNAPNDYEPLGGKTSHLSLYIDRHQASIIQSVISSCTTQDPALRPPIDELLALSLNVQQLLLQALQPEPKRQMLSEVLQRFTLRVENSPTYIDAGRHKSEINIKLTELNESVDTLCDALTEKVLDLNKNGPKDIGEFTLNPVNEGDAYLLPQGAFNVVRNDAQKKWLSLMYMPSKKVKAHTGSSYCALFFFLGFTESQKFYWVVQLIDQPFTGHVVIDTLETRALATVVGQKISQLDEFVKQFLDVIQSHF